MMYEDIAVDALLKKNEVFIIRHQLSDFFLPDSFQLGTVKLGAEFRSGLAGSMQKIVREAYESGGEFRASIVNKEPGVIDLFLSLIDKNKKTVFITQPFTVGMVPPPKVYKPRGRKPRKGVAT